MLISLKVGNFRSFDTDQELSFAAGADRMHETSHCLRTGIKALPRLVRSALIFGPNAAGKSNLIRALATLRDIMQSGEAITETQFAARYQPFRWRAPSAQPTRFTIDVLLGAVRYRYSLAYDPVRIRHEQLLVHRTGKAQRWFLRNWNEAQQCEEWAPFSPNFTGPREMWRKATRARATFVSTAAGLGAELLQPLHRWFTEGLEILTAESASAIGRSGAGLQEAALRASVLEMLDAADVPIQDLRVDGVEPEFLHAGDTPAWLGANDESSGTLHFIGMLLPMLRAAARGSLLVMDDFDAGLHPLLARCFLTIVHRRAQRLQVLLTTHDSALMDLGLLRRDEVWLAQLDRRHASLLAPLAAHSPRKREIVAKAYLRGRYGAIPHIRARCG